MASRTSTWDCTAAALIATTLCVTAVASPPVVPPELLFARSDERLAAFPEPVKKRLEACTAPVIVVPADMPQTADLAHRIGEEAVQCVVIESPRIEPAFLAALVKASGADGLGLPGLTQLDAATLDALKNLRARTIFLDNVQTLSTQEAVALAECSSGAWLHLPAVRQLEPAALKALAGQFSHLFLDSLQSFTLAHADALEGWSCNTLSLGTPSLDVGVAKKLPSCSTLQLAVQQLPSPLAATIASRSYSRLILPKLTRLDPAAAAGLATGDYAYLDLGGLRSLTPAAGTSLAKMKADVLKLDGLDALPVDLAQALGASNLRWISLASVTELSPEAAKALTTLPASPIVHLELTGLQGLPLSLAQVLGASDKMINTKLRLGHLDQALANSLASLDQRELDLTITGFDHDPALFKRFKGATLRVQTSSLAPEAAAALAAWEGRILEVHVGSLDAATAGILARAKVDQLLIGVTTLSSATATPLQGFAGAQINLPNLHTLDLDTARALTAWGSKDSRLAIGLRTKVPADVAGVLAKWPGHLHFHSSKQRVLGEQ